MYNKYRTLIVRAVYGLIALALLSAPAIATSGVWSWSDHSTLLPYRDEVAVGMISARQNDWMVSDGVHAYHYDGTTVVDMTRALRDRGMLGVSGIYSDHRQWLVSYRPIDRTDSQLWLTDGQTWTDVAGKFPTLDSGIDAVGNDGVWYVRTYHKATVSQPGSWDLWYWNGTYSNPTHVAVPSAIPSISSGCFVYLDGSKLCTGVNTPVYVNGAWYFIGGSSEARGVNGTITQAAKASLWKMDGEVFTAVPQIPNVKFISGVWTSPSGALVATSDAVSNPFAADHLWLFDGSTWRDLSTSALQMGLLSVDARELHAAWNGRSWMILAGKKEVRFDGVRMTSMGNTRDSFQALSSDAAGRFVLGGAVSDQDHEFATKPLMAQLALVNEDLTAAASVVPLVSGSVSEILSSVYGPTVTISSNPVDTHIGNGRSFTLQASADDANGVERIDIYVNGGRVKSCPGNACEYTQTYWTNGATSRKVEMYAHAVDAQGYANESQKINLLVDMNSQASGALASANSAEPILPDHVPANQVWNKDAASGIHWATWTEPNQTLLATGGKMVYAVAANDANGLSKIEVWVNGTVTRTCQMSGSKATNLCSVTLVGSDYPYGTEVFMNANVYDAKGKNAWTSGTRVRRDTSAVSIASASAPAQTFVTPTGPVFRSSITVDPNASEIVRGGIVKVHSQSQNNILGLARVELYLNGSILSACTSGAVVDTTVCDATIDTATYVQGSTLTIMARAIDASGHETWSNAKSITVRTATSVVAASASNGMSVWSWLSPQVAELSEGQTADYSVGSWSPKGIVKIEMLVDGVVRRTCLPTTLTGNKECTYTVMTYDYSQGHVASVNARITDAIGQVMWSEPRFITIKRSWEPLNNPGPYVSVTNDHPNGYTYGDKMQLVARGWSPAGMDRLDIFVNGSKVASCASDACSYTSAAYFQSSFEYAVRLVDRQGQETWTAVLGVNKK